MLKSLNHNTLALQKVTKAVDSRAQPGCAPNPAIGAGRAVGRCHTGIARLQPDAILQFESHQLSLNTKIPPEKVAFLYLAEKVGFRILCYAKSAALRLPFRSAWAAPYSQVHRTCSLTVALAGFESHQLSLNTKIPPEKVAFLYLAEKVGFEPTSLLRDYLISSQGRYDHFDTSP